MPRCAMHNAEGDWSWTNRAQQTAKGHGWSGTVFRLKAGRALVVQSTEHHLWPSKFESAVKLIWQQPPNRKQVRKNEYLESDTNIGQKMYSQCVFTSNSHHAPTTNRYKTTYLFF